MPTSSELRSSGTLLSESRDTKLCRSSRGVQWLGSIPAAFMIAARKSRRTLAPLNGVPGGEDHAQVVPPAIPRVLGLLVLPSAQLAQGCHAPPRQGYS